MREYQQQLTDQPFRNPRTCPVCGRILFSGPGFRYHQQRHRRDNQSFPCDNCRKVFKSFNGLKYHQKRKRCQGHTVTRPDGCGSDHVARNPASYETGRLMELAQIATGPQSPLLRSPGPDSRGSATGGFFDECETSAAMTLSSMKQKCSSSEAPSAVICSSEAPSAVICSSEDPSAVICSSEAPSAVICSSEAPSAAISSRITEKQEQPERPKRPMNGFMMFAQRNRTELNKKYPDMNNRMISTKLSEEWKRLPDGERRRWVDEAKEKAKQHQKQHPDCWKRKK